MPKQINVKLGFEADTSQAKKQLQDLQNQLSKLTVQSGSNNNLSITKDIQEATVAAARLKVELKEAINPTTGTLDLSKFQQSLKQSGTSLEQYKQSLERLGPEGTKAFNQLGNAILASEIPLKRTNQLLDQFATALKNTVRWQFSSSALHGFMGAIQGAYGYAQDLNASLNSIRIVSGQSAEQMARFADQANKSAQALSTSTLAYTDAALIFYQQGLAGNEVTERVDTVLKLSNVTGDSAEQVSNYMTAIWNNFYDGSQSLESFADKITALGAATASSSAEISAGLQQFAAIGNTVGLSYDYAATALATIVAQTRQSESTVGNGLRTVFARLSSLKDGGVEDGIDLTKYTEALQGVGVSVLDQNGQLKEMDAILDDIGEKWQTLDKNQRVALAQTVGGVRQYATIMALFDNWDQFQKNLDVTRNADGALQEQAEIYAESWQAAQKRVKAAWQAIYQDLIDDKFFITMLNGLESVLHGVDQLIETFGGLGGVLSTLGAIATQLFSKQLTQGVSDLLYNLTPLSIKQKDDVTTKEETLKLMFPGEQSDYTTVGQQEYKIQSDNYDIQKQILANSNKLSDKDKEILGLLTEQRSELEKISIERAKSLQEAKETSEKSAVNLMRQAMGSNGIPDQAQWIEDRVALEDLTRNAYGLGINSDAAFEANGELEDHIQAMIEYYGLSEQAVRKYVETIENEIAAEKALDDSNKNLEQSQGSINNLLQGTAAIAPSVADSIVHLAQAGTALLSAINAIKGMWETIQNPDLSFIEKLASVMTTIVTVSMLLSRAKMVETGKSIVNTAATIAETVAKMANAKASKAQATESQKVAAKKALEAAANAKSSAAISGLGAAFKSLGASLSVIGPYLIPIAVGIGAVALAIWGLDKDIYTTKEQLADANKALEKSNEELSRASDSAQKANDAYKKLQETFDGFADRKEVIDKMTEGTLEWKDAITASNKELLDSLEAAGQLGKVNYDGRGLASISPEDQQKVLEASRQNANMQNIRELYAKTDVSEKQLNQFLAELTHELGAYKAEVLMDQGSPYEYRQSLDAAGTKDLLENFGTKIADAGMAGLTGEELLREYQAGNQKLEFLSQIPDLANNADLLDAIASAANTISASFTEADAYKTEMGRQVLDNTGIETPDWASAAMSKAIGDALYQGFTDEEITSKMNNLLPEDKALYAANTEGVNWNATKGQFVDNSGQKIEVDEESIARLVMLIDAINNFDANSTENQGVLQQAEYAARDQLAHDTVAKSGISGPEQQQAFEEWFNSLNSEDLSLLAKIDINEEDSLETIQQKMEDMEHMMNFQIDADVDPEELENLKNYIYENATAIDDLDDHLAECEAEANKVAHSILRFDDAIQDVSENYDDWMAQLSSGSLQDVAAAIDDIQDAYGDLLDIDPSVLSDGFLRSTQNMEDMKAAIEGDEEAYNRLQEAMGQDIVAGLKLDDADLANFNSALAEVQNAIDGMNWQEIKVGADLDNGNFLQKLTDMVNAAGMTAEQATAYLASMGIDAEIETVPEDIKTVKTTRQYWVPPTYTTTPIPVGGTEQPETYNQLEVAEPGHFEPVEENSTEEASPNAWSLKVTSAHKSSGGGFKFNNSSHGAGSKGTGAPSKGGKSGGGGGGSSKKKTVKEHKKPEKKEDRYHDIKERIEDLNTEL